MPNRPPAAQKSLAFARRVLPLAVWAVPLVALTLLVLELSGVSAPVPFAWKLLPLTLTSAAALELLRGAEDHPLGPLLYSVSQTQALWAIGGEALALCLNPAAFPAGAALLHLLLVLAHMSVALVSAPKLERAAREP